MRLVPQPNAEPDGFPVGSPYTSGTRTYLATQVADIFRRPGIEAHAFIPGIGMLSGLPLINAIMEDGTQAASVDNPMGYMGDPIATVGSELCLDPTFDDPARWTTSSGWAVTGGKLVVTAAVNGTNTYQIGALSGATNKSYEITFTISSHTSGQVRVSLEGANSLNFNAAGTYTVRLTATVATPRIFITATANGTTLEVDNISVRELVGAIPARQATTANKPILRRGAVNRFLNTRLVGASSGAPGAAPTTVTVSSALNGITREMVAVGTLPSGDQYMDVRFFGTASTATFFQIGSSANLIAASQGQQWVAGFDLAVLPPKNFSSQLNIYLTERTAAGALVAGAETAVNVAGVLTEELSRLTVSRVITNATTQRVQARIGFNAPAGTPMDLTIRVSRPALWQTAVGVTTEPTSGFVHTTESAPASSPTGPFWAEFDGTDFLSLATVPFGFNDNLLFVGAAYNNQNATNNRLFAATGTTAVLRINWDAAASKYVCVFTNDAGASVQLPSPAPTIALGQVSVVSVRQAGSNKVMRTDGIAATASTAAVGAGTLTAAGIGAQGGAIPWVGGIFSALAIRDVGGVLTDADVAILERYVAQGAGVTL